jgi:hypothetical protein
MAYFEGVVKTAKPIWPVINNTNNISFSSMVSAVREGQGKPMYELKQQQADAGKPLFCSYLDHDGPALLGVVTIPLQQQAEATGCEVNSPAFNQLCSYMKVVPYVFQGRTRELISNSNILLSQGHGRKQGPRMLAKCFENCSSQVGWLIR